MRRFISRRIVVAVSGLSVLGGIGAAAALAAGPGVPTTPSPPGVPVTAPGTPVQTPAGPVPPDTELTPVPKDACTAGWTQIAGSVYPQASLCDKAQYDATLTPANLDFFAVRFAPGTTLDGYAGGAACSDASVATLDACPVSKRMPVLWHYTQKPGYPGTWAPVSDFPGSSGPGYVGGIAYMTDGHILVVGGTGQFPRREGGNPGADPPLTADASTPQNDPAGMARVWLYDGSSWSELTNLPQTQDGEAMRGLDTVDCSPRAADGHGELCFAGAFGQLWTWSGGRFSTGLDAQSAMSGGTASGAARALDFRVRAIRFVPGGHLPATIDNTPTVLAYAATSGCCFAGPSDIHDASQDLPWMLNYTAGGWQQSQTTNSAGAGLAADSYYAVYAAYIPSPSTEAVNTVLAPGWPAATSGAVPEPSSSGGTGDETSRLVSADGDPSVDVGIEWEAGWMTSAAQADRGAVYTPSSTTLPSFNPCGQGGVSTTGGLSVSTSCTPNQPSQDEAQLASRSLFTTSSYALNALAITRAGQGWAVGDRGAIVRLGGHGSQSAVQEPAAPVLGSRAEASFGASAPYPEPATSGTSVGQVPGLGDQPLEPLTSPRVIPGGEPDPANYGAFGDSVSSIVMSRDGSEGWAVGPSPTGSPPTRTAETTLYHYLDGRWQACDVAGSPPVIQPDPACASLAVLRQANPQPAIYALARVPYEDTGDPSQANRFELVGVGSASGLGPDGRQESVVVRYAGGRWSVDHAGLQGANPPGDLFANEALTSVAYGAPDDGWILRSDNGTIELFHFDGLAWTVCGTSSSGNISARCGALPPLNNVGNPQLTSAGDRVYLYGQHNANGGGSYPLIAYEAHGVWHTDPSCQDGSCDPAAAASPDPSQQGTVSALSVIEDPDGSYSGWAVGRFGGTGLPGLSANSGLTNADTSATHQNGAAFLMRLNPSGKWSPWVQDDASADYLGTSAATNPPTFVQTLSADGRAVIAPAAGGGGIGGPSLPPVTFDPTSARWTTLGTPYMSGGGALEREADTDAIGSDGRGGLWLAAQRDFANGAGDPVIFYHYTKSVHRSVFSDVPQPVREQITAASGGSDASFWVATASGAVYRYDRGTGWDRLVVPGWNLGLATAGAPAYAIAVDHHGDGVVVGAGGRIADLSHWGAILDPAAGVLCSQHPELTRAGPCGTSHDLRAAAVAPDGAALVGGDDRTLLWRSAGQAFRAISPPDTVPSATITGISMPASDHAWVTDSVGEVFAGTLESGGWSWQLEDTAPGGQLLSIGSDDTNLPLTGIAVSPSGQGFEGFAVGRRGLILQLRPDGSWHRLDDGYLDDLWSVAVPAGGGGGALIGGGSGLVLTYQSGHFVVAHPADPYDPVSWGGTADCDSRVIGVALLGGERPGEVEAWAANQASSGSCNYQRSPAPSQILHYSSDPSDPLLDADVGRVVPLPDAPPPRLGEIRFAAFGKSDCQAGDCEAMTGVNLANEVDAQAIARAIIRSAASPAGADFSLFTGDASDGTDALPGSPSLAHRRWVEKIADPLLGASVPVFGALGGEDLASSNTSSTPGPNFAWRQALAGMPSPWGAPGNQTAAASHGLSFVAVGPSQVAGHPAAIEGPTATVPGASVGIPAAPAGVPAGGESASVGSVSASAGGAHTHYAFDVERDGRPVLRVAVADTSLKTLSTAGGEENPVESQLKWLSDVLSNRPSGELAVVVSETPSYSYGPGASTDTLTDSPAFETLMAEYKVTAVVSGRLGWNGVYYTSAGLHCPQPNGAYPDPSTGCSPTSEGVSSQHQPGQAAGGALSTLAGALTGTAAPAAPPSDATLGAYPTVIAASAGGKFGPQDQPSSGSASQGYWHGYSLVRIEPNGSVVVEQRPVFDWIGIDGPSHDLQPGQHMKLHGYGREPVGMDQPIRYDDIDSYAITHRFDLVEADPARPWLPLVDPASPAPNHYVPVDPSVASIDRQTGFIQTGSGSHPRVYVIAILSVGDQAASWPVAFEPRRNFTQRPGILPALPAVAPPAPVPPVHVAAALPTPPPPPTGAPPVPPEVGTPSLPQLPGLTPPPPVAAVSPPTPPAPPAPPPPPGQPAPLPLALNAKLSPIGINATVVPPSPPPVNPAPPSGSAARKEAKQRQAATAKSEEGGTPEAAEQQGLGGDPVVNPPSSQGAPFSRRDATLSFSRSQPSAWSRDLFYGGMLGIGALVLALAAGALGMTPRGTQRTQAARAWERRH